MHIYKIFRPDEWQALLRDGTTDGAPVDLADGFIHFSTASQAAETAAKHFAGAQGLVLAVCDADDFGEALKWEPSRGGALFPHLYAPLALAQVIAHHPLPLQDGAHLFPAAMT
ncbi:DUF952 domain-containing protein [Pseudooceanicola aestuarii]|uniref:DUF952 domain-containing protein n=1 Tax=Pseudooceanicola aestuarii TaxID=2697319 RepID=UPI0013D4B650|nr:DUF952 domain-containing protein [Pseudooceanicola aestuarii]